jgi:hypothetical protein
MTSIDSSLHHAGTAEPTLTNLNEEFSEHWDIWRSTVTLTGESADALRDQIRAADRLIADRNTG